MGIGVLKVDFLQFRDVSFYDQLRRLHNLHTGLTSTQPPQRLQDLCGGCKSFARKRRWSTYSGFGQSSFWFLYKQSFSQPPP